MAAPAKAGPGLPTFESAPGARANSLTDVPLSRRDRYQDLCSDHRRLVLTEALKANAP